MDWKWVLLMPHILSLYITLASEVVVQVNTKKWIYYVPERFLSLTVDPLTLAAASPLTQESFNMAKGLSPSFVRIGGIGTNALIFGKEFMVNSSTVSESQWDSVNDFAKGTGLDIIASLNPSIQVQGVWDSQNSLELISYSNEKQYNVVWQLGYDVRGYNASGAEIGRDLVRLAKILDGFPKYAGSPVFGPDISSVFGAKQVHFVKDMLTNAGNSMGSLILQPKFSNGVEPEDCHDLMTSMISELDTYVWSKEARLGKAIPKKPVWIAESTASKGSFREAIQLVKRLGVAARIGIQIYMRQAGAISLKSLTPEFWFSLLYKNLVGQGVLDYKIVSQNQSQLHVFAHCTASVPQDRSVLDTDWIYEKGAVTLFGVNESPEPVKLVLRVTSKEEPLHIYVLTSDTRVEPGKNPATLLNGQELRLSPTWDLPVLSPKVKRPNKAASVMLPGSSIFFIVMPDSKIRTCSIPPLVTPDLNLSDLSKRLRLGPSRKAETLKEEEEIEPSEDLMNEGVYVAFTKKKRHDTEAKNDNTRADIIGKSLMETIISKLAPKNNEERTTKRPASNEEMPVYITFNERSFLNKLAEGVKEELKEEDQQEIDVKIDKYAPLTAAMSINRPEVNNDKPSEVTDKDVDRDVTDRDVDVIKIEPGDKKANILPVLDPNHEKDGYRIRRSSNEDPPPGSSNLGHTEPMEIIKKINEYRKTGVPIDDEVGKVARSLDDVTVSVTNSEVDPDQIGDKTRSIRHIGSGGEEPDYGNVVCNTGTTKQVLVSDQVSEKEKDHDDDEDVAQKTSALVKVVQQTEKVENVSETPGSVIVPPEVSEKKLDEIMLETAKLTSEPETQGDYAPKEERSNVGTMSPQIASDTEVQVMGSQSRSSPSTTNILSLGQPQPVAHPSQIQSSSDGQNVPIVTIGRIPGAQVLPGSLIISNPIMLQPSTQEQTISIPAQTKAIHILKIPLPTTQKNAEPNELISGENNVPTVMSLVPSNNPVVSFYNEQKETAINNRLTKIVTEEDSKLSKISTEPAEPNVTEEGSEFTDVPLPGNDKILTASEDDKKISKDQDTSDGIKTLENESPRIEVANEDDRPSVKVLRQTGAKTPKAVRVAVTPLSQTATLSAPAVQDVSSTPAGPVSPFKTPQDSNKPLQINQVREPLKAPTPEELREKFKSLREKMLELRAQYMIAREKRLEDIKKQVAARAPTPGSEGDEAIKSTIKRRGAELKEWFRKFDKRDTQPSQVVPLEDVKDVKPRPRRLSLFTNNEGLDMAKFFDEEPSESYNYKRSPEMSNQNRYQHLPVVSDSPTSPKTGPLGKHIFPLDTKTHGIVYNNKIYPAKLFGYIDHSDLENMPHTKEEPAKNGIPTADQKFEDEKFKGQAKDVETSMEIPKSRERIAFVPRDAFIKEMKSDFIPVIIIPPDESEEMKIDDLSLGREKRSTIDSLENQFHQLKEELLPKISSWIKNLSENPPWKRDLERSSRNRRSIDDILRTNDLRSLLVPKVPTRKNKEMRMEEIEDVVVDKIDKGEDDIYATAKKYGGLAEKIGGQVLMKELVEQSDAQLDKSSDMGYCEEVGSSKQSVIRDPFEKPDVGKMEMEPDETKHESKMAQLESSKVKSTKTSNESTVVASASSSPTFEESLFASVIANKIKDFFDALRNWMETPPTDS